MGAWTEIVDYTVPSNTTSVVLNDFGTITKNDFIKVVATFTNVGSSSNFIDVNLLANSTSATDYHVQRLSGDGSTVAAVRENRPPIHLGNSGSSITGVTVGYLKLSENDRLNMFFNDTRRINAAGSESVVNFMYSTSSGATFTSGITSLTFSANNSIASGSRIQIYRLDAEKVADITVGSNTTQVDISSLSIDKDSEYLLVSDVTGATATHFVVVTPNDLTTLSGYYTQRIQGSGSTASASRGNQNRIQEGLSTENSLAYVHIKLSNIGAYTMQSYSSRASGSSTVDVQNWFTSSTSESITSITKLNIFTTNANAIGAGSRFLLYKLK